MINLFIFGVFGVGLVVVACVVLACILGVFESIFRSPPETRKPVYKFGIDNNPPLY